jgi:formylmethanofuran dehydrogenase subunit D
MLYALAKLGSEADPAGSDEFPFVLIAGERRSYNANQVFRDPAWRRTDPEGALQIHPEDVRSSGLIGGIRAVCVSSRGSIDVRSELNPGLRPGVVTLPRGYGMDWVGVVVSPPGSSSRSPPQCEVSGSVTGTNNCLDVTVVCLRHLLGIFGACSGVARLAELAWCSSRKADEHLIGWMRNSGSNEILELTQLIESQIAAQTGKRDPWAAFDRPACPRERGIAEIGSWKVYREGSLEHRQIRLTRLL